jgi:hypothetical protein
MRHDCPKKPTPKYTSATQQAHHDQHQHHHHDRMPLTFRPFEGRPSPNNFTSSLPQYSLSCPFRASPCHARDLRARVCCNSSRACAQVGSSIARRRGGADPRPPPRIRIRPVALVVGVSPAANPTCPHANTDRTDAKVHTFVARARSRRRCHRRCLKRPHRAAPPASGGKSALTALTM